MGANEPSADDAHKERFYKSIWSEITANLIDGITSEESKIKLELRKDDYTLTRIYGTMMRDGSTILWILLVECNPDSKISFDAHYAIIDNATFSKHNNDVNNSCTALKQAKSDIIRNCGTYPENIYKLFSIKELKSGSNAEFNEYVCQKTNTWNETGNIDLYKLFWDCNT